MEGLFVKEMGDLGCLKNFYKNRELRDNTRFGRGVFERKIGYFLGVWGAPISFCVQMFANIRGCMCANCLTYM